MKRVIFYDRSKTTGKFENMIIHDFLGNFAIHYFIFEVRIFKISMEIVDKFIFVNFWVSE